MTRAERIERAARALVDDVHDSYAQHLAAFDALRSALSEEEGTPATGLCTDRDPCNYRVPLPSPATTSEAPCAYCMGTGRGSGGKAYLADCGKCGGTGRWS